MEPALSSTPWTRSHTAASPKGQGDTVEKKPYLTREDILRIRETVDADYERDVKKLTGDTTDDLGRIQEPPPAAGPETTPSAPVQDS